MVHNGVNFFTSVFILENAKGPDRLFFELASESRLGILREVEAKNLKMPEVARRLGLTGTEAFRQLQRLSEALLVQKQPEGTYAITLYGKLVLQLASALEFVFKHKEYFSTHDVWWLPQQFLDRIGELSQTNLRMSMGETLGRIPQMVREAEQYVWGFSPEPLLTESFEVISKQIPKGVEYKFLSPYPPTKLPNLENRTLFDAPLIVITEKEATVCFRFIGGRVDYAGFFGKDPVFLNWIKDLFLYYWDKGKRD
jgi:predicted transcriptional regulator